MHQNRAKDLVDLRSLLHHYERDSERIFSDIVFEADLPDIEFATAFLLGSDLREIASEGGRSLVKSFVAKLMKSPESPHKPTHDDDWRARDAYRFHEQIAAFAKGFNRSEA